MRNDLAELEDKYKLTVNIEDLEPNRTYYEVNGYIFKEPEDIKEFYINDYVVLDDDQPDFITAEEEDAEEKTGFQILMEEYKSLKSYAYEERNS